VVVVQLHGPSGPIKSILTGSITAWYGNCSASVYKALQRVVFMAQYITKLPAIKASIQGSVRRRPPKIVCNQQPSLWPKAIRMLNSFYPQAIRLLNSFYPKAIRLLNSFYPQAIRLLNSSSNAIYIDPLLFSFIFFIVLHWLPCTRLYAHIYTYYTDTPTHTHTPTHTLSHTHALTHRHSFTRHICWCYYLLIIY
jgi:hypothetical protein